MVNGSIGMAARAALATRGGLVPLRLVTLVGGGISVFPHLEATVRPSETQQRTAIAEFVVAAHPCGLVVYPVTAAGCALNELMTNELSRAALSRLVADKRIGPCQESRGDSGTSRTAISALASARGRAKRTRVALYGYTAWAEPACAGSRKRLRLALPASDSYAGVRRLCSICAPRCRAIC